MLVDSSRPIGSTLDRIPPGSGRSSVLLESEPVELVIAESFFAGQDGAEPHTVILVLFIFFRGIGNWAGTLAPVQRILVSLRNDYPGGL